MLSSHPNRHFCKPIMPISQRKKAYFATQEGRFCKAEHPKPCRKATMQHPTLMLRLRQSTQFTHRDGPNGLTDEY